MRACDVSQSAVVTAMEPRFSVVWSGEILNGCVCVCLWCLIINIINELRMDRTETGAI